jgi:hypothetical protein
VQRIEVVLVHSVRVHGERRHGHGKWQRMCVEAMVERCVRMAAHAERWGRTHEAHDGRRTSGSDHGTQGHGQRQGRHRQTVLQRSVRVQVRGVRVAFEAAQTEAEAAAAATNSSRLRIGLLRGLLVLLRSERRGAKGIERCHRRQMMMMVQLVSYGRTVAAHAHWRRRGHLAIIARRVGLVVVVVVMVQRTLRR